MAWVWSRRSLTSPAGRPMYTDPLLMSLPAAARRELAGLASGVFGLLVVCFGAPGHAAAQPDVDYVLGARDVLRISVFDQTDLSGTYTVEADGSFSFPLIGRITAAGLTVRALEQALKGRLADGYFRDPQVIVAVEEYHSQRVFVVGEVRQPGAYPMSGGMSLIEVLAAAGSTTLAAAADLIVVRAGQSPEAAGDAENVRVNLRDLQSGVLEDNVTLRNGDTVFVPRAETIYVFGEVRRPGPYPLDETDITVLQALSMAGGGTEFGALNRVRIVRIVDGEQQEFRVDLDDVVRSGDTIIVPERFF